MVMRDRLVSTFFLAATPLLLLTGQVSGFFQAEAGVWLSWLALPFVWETGPAPKAPWRWALMAAVLLVVVAWAPVRTLLFLAGFSVWLFAVESFGGRVSGRLAVLGLLLSPLFYVASHVFTFPLRLHLTRWAGWLLQASGMPVRVEGNVLVKAADQARYVVEPACEGLVLTQTAAVLLVFLLAYESRRQRRRLPVVAEMALLLAGLGAALAANLVRVVLLVRFGLAPTALAHDIVGLLALLFYAVFPSWALIRLSYRLAPALPAEDRVAAGPPVLFRRVFGANAVLLLIFGVHMAQFRQVLPPDLMARFGRAPQGFDQQRLPGGILQYSASGLLIYLKPIPSFYASEHHPALCWEGSGYRLVSVQESRLAGQPLYTGMLEGPEGRLYTAWWYDNGATRTIGQWEWRRRQWAGEPAFCIVNVTVSERSRLEGAVKSVLRAGLVPP